ncbi:hypothetical protein F511_28186 [Dorcoceras hygrometricum]|uniref:Uncharacterized protein n=1 Tax=Dorcoceras hygrometricum TaxID=472368 RepID=A0A2Z7AE05_9LAMI|nr:hypothetical protein F511_28186 [Dorcoceras hygrometricum]
MFLFYLFYEMSPIQFPLEFLPEISQFLLEKDLSFWVAFMFYTLIVFLKVRKYFKILVSSDSLETDKSFLLLGFLGVVLVIPLSVLYPEIAYCDEKNALSPPPSPVPLPGEPITPPEAPPVPQPVVIPQVENPLLLDEARRNILYTRYTLLNLGGNDDLGRMVSIIDNQVVVERSVEAALLEDGFTREAIMARYTEIRGILHSPQGELLSNRTYESYVTQIRGQGTRQSVPYRRIVRAIQNFDLLLER